MSPSHRVQLDVEVSGQGAPWIVALHGIQGTRSAWQAVASACADLGTWVLPNLRGRAAAVRGTQAADYTLSAFADEVEAVLARHVGEAPFYLAGWSLGVSVALQCLLKRPALRPRGLILLSGSPSLASVDWFQGDGTALQQSVVQRAQRLGLREYADPQAVAWTWQAVRRTDQRPLLGGLQMPALVLHGADDGDCPAEHGRWLADALPRARLHLLPGAGHGLPVEQAAWVGKQLRDFIHATEQREFP